MFCSGYGGGLDFQINQLFNRHDYNRSGYLGLVELQTFLNELFPAMGYQYYINLNQAREILYEIDRNCDGRASRREVKIMYHHILQNAARYGLGGHCGMNNSVGFGGGGYGGYGGFGGHGMTVSVGYSGGYSPYNGGGFTSGCGGFSYNGSWNNSHDQFLRNQIDRVYAMYDYNRTGQLEGNEFYSAYRDLCASVGQVAPTDWFSIRQIAMQADTNYDGRISKMEMFNLFKRAQFNLY